MTAKRGIAADGAALECVFEFILAHKRLLGEGRCNIRKTLAVETMDGQIDAEALFGAVGELFVERDTDVDDADAFPIAHDRRHAVDAEGFPSGFDAGNR